MAGVRRGLADREPGGPPVTYHWAAVVHDQAGLDAVMGARVRPVMLRIDTRPSVLIRLHLRRSWLPFAVTVCHDSLVNVIAPDGTRATISAVDSSRVSVAGDVLVGAHGLASVIAAAGARVIVNDLATCVRSDSTVFAHQASERAFIVDSFPED